MKEVVGENKSNDLEDSATTYILSLINVRIKVEASPSASVSGTTAQLPPPPPSPIPSHQLPIKTDREEIKMT